MDEDKGSDLDVFEGLAKKKRPASEANPAAKETMQGGMAAPPASKPLPPPKPLPKPTPPPSKREHASTELIGGGPAAPAASFSAREPQPAPVSLPKPTPPPRRESTPEIEVRRLDSDPPDITVRPLDLPSRPFDDPEPSVLPGIAAADLDWDDAEEATNVFDRSEHDLFGDVGGPLGRPGFGRPRPVVADDPDETSKRDLRKAAAVLAASGGTAKAVQRPAAPAPTYGFDAVPRIPAPAPVPRDMTPIPGPLPAPPLPRVEMPSSPPPHPSWVPASQHAQPQAAPPRRGMGMVVMAVLLVAAIVGGVFFYSRTLAGGTLKVKVTHEGKDVDTAVVYVDGRRECEFTPCVLENLKPGEKQLRVVSGHLAGSQDVEVIGGKEVVITIPLGVSGDTAPSGEPPSATGPASLKLSSSMAGVKVIVDGDDKGALPVEVKNLEPGKHKLLFEAGKDTPGASGYGKLEKIVELAAGQALALDDVKLPLLKVKVTFELKTEGAKVKLVQSGERKSESWLTFRAGTADRELDTSFTWAIEASAKGFRDLSQPLSFDDQKPEKTVPIELQKEDEAAPPVTAVVPPPPITVAQPEPKQEPKQEPKKDPVPAGKMGFINANSIPPSKVLIDGRPHGETPVTGVSVSPGSHTVVFIHKKLGQMSRTVTVAAGQTKTAAVRFKKKEGEE